MWCSSLASYNGNKRYFGRAVRSGKPSSPSGDTSNVNVDDVVVHRRLERGHTDLLTADVVRHGAYPDKHVLYEATSKTIMVGVSYVSVSLHLQAIFMPAAFRRALRDARDSKYRFQRGWSYCRCRTSRHVAGADEYNV